MIRWVLSLLWGLLGWFRRKPEKIGPCQPRPYVCAGCFLHGGTLEVKEGMYVHPGCSPNWPKIRREIAKGKVKMPAGYKQ